MPTSRGLMDSTAGLLPVSTVVRCGTSAPRPPPWDGLDTSRFVRMNEYA